MSERVGVQSEIENETRKKKKADSGERERAERFRKSAKHKIEKVKA